jgi:hypothetical protein
MGMTVLQVLFVPTNFARVANFFQLLVNSGSNNVTVRNMVCEGGHGASLSGTDKIANVHFDNITSRNSLYASKLSLVITY